MGRGRPKVERLTSLEQVLVNILISPRWIVEERPDATNVNNWHWTEKNADAWSKAKIKVEGLKA